MQLIVARKLRGFIPEFDPANPASPGFHIPGDGCSIPFKNGDQRLDESFKDFRSSVIFQMYLPNFLGAKDLGSESPPGQPEFGRFAGGSHHGTLLDRHRDGVHGIVYPEVGSDPQRQVKVADGVFDEFIVQLLQFGIGIPVLTQYSFRCFRMLGIAGSDPADLFRLAHFGETLYGLGHRVKILRQRYAIRANAPPDKAWETPWKVLAKVVNTANYS